MDKKIMVNNLEINTQKKNPEKFIQKLENLCRKYTKNDKEYFFNYKIMN